MDARVLNNECQGLEGHEGIKILKPIVIKLLLHPFLGIPQPSCRDRFFATVCEGTAATYPRNVVGSIPLV